jgi:hypothetical protein
LFLGLITGGLLLGWGTAKRLFEGITTPTLNTPSGLSIRITPEHALWFTSHTKGLTLNNSCPIDIPTLIALNAPSRLIIGDSGTQVSVAFTGKAPSMLKNYEKTFGCKVIVSKKSYIVTEKSEETPNISSRMLFTTPSGWAWSGKETKAINLHDHGISIALPKRTTNELIPWPEQILTTALPLKKISPNSMPQIWQGLSDLFASEQGIAFFSWKNNEETAIALSIQGKLNENEIIALIYDIGNIPTISKKQLRKDEITYTATKQEELFIYWINETTGEVRLKNEVIIGYFTQKDERTLISTAPTSWTITSPHWEAVLVKSNPTTHRAKNITNFGKKIFTTKKNITIFEK